MSYTSRVMAASAKQTFAVLVDPTTYPRWLVGAAAMRDVDPEWPRPGSRFHHVVGFGPIRIADNSEVLDVSDGCLLRMKVRARPLISAVVTFRVIGCGRQCVVTFEEEPAVRTIGNLVRPVMDPVTHMRNHQSLRLLAAIVEDGAGADLASNP